MTDFNVVAVHDDWFVRANRESVYTIISDFERMPKHFPKVARAMRLVKRDGDVLTNEAEAASCGSLFPTVKLEMTATLLPGRGYCFTTHNLTFNTTQVTQDSSSGVQEGIEVTSVQGQLASNEPATEYINTRTGLYFEPLQVVVGQ